MRSMAFFNNKGGVGKTSLTYHLAWMFSERGIKTLAVDLDPQANLTAMFLPEDRIESLWSDSSDPKTIYGSIRPILRGVGDIKAPQVERITDTLALLPGDLDLSRFEDKLSDAWPRCHNKDESAFRIMTAFHRCIKEAAAWGSDLILIDVGPNLGAINRSALIASDEVMLPLAPDLFSLQGLHNLGPALSEWRSTWNEMMQKAPPDLDMPMGRMAPQGYVVLQVGVRSESRPVKSYQRWMERIPGAYLRDILNQPNTVVPAITEDAHCLALLKHYRSLMPMAMEARKPMFFLKNADGAIGAHAGAVKNCYADFFKLAKRIAGDAELPYFS